MFLRSWQVKNWSRISPHFIEPEGSLPPLQVPTTCHYPQPYQSTPRPVSQRGLLPSGFPTKTLVVPLLAHIRATRPAHLILLDLITQTTLYWIYLNINSSYRIGSNVIRCNRNKPI